MSDISRHGLDQGKLVELLANITGSKCYSFSEFQGVGANSATLVDLTNSVAWGFADAATEQIFAICDVPADMDTTAASTLNIYWSSTDTAGNDVRWVPGISSHGVGDDISGAMEATPTETSTDSTTANGIVKSGDITVNANVLVPGEVFVLRILRDGLNAADTLTARADLHYVSLRYTTKPSIDAST